MGLSKCSGSRACILCQYVCVGGVCVFDKHDDDDQPLLYVTFRNTLISLMLHSCCFVCFFVSFRVVEVDYCKRLV